jgi:hypothetical protein
LEREGEGVSVVVVVLARVLAVMVTVVVAVAVPLRVVRVVVVVVAVDAEERRRFAGRGESVEPIGEPLEISSVSLYVLFDVPFAYWNLLSVPLNEGVVVVGAFESPPACSSTGVEARFELADRVRAILSDCVRNEEKRKDTLKIYGNVNECGSFRTSGCGGCEKCLLLPPGSSSMPICTLWVTVELPGT